MTEPIAETRTIPAEMSLATFACFVHFTVIRFVTSSTEVLIISLVKTNSMVKTNIASSVVLNRSKTAAITTAVATIA